MDHNIKPLERAFQLARSGTCQSVEDIKKKMKSEGYAISQVEGRSLSNQLRALIREAKGTPVSDVQEGGDQTAGNAEVAAKAAGKAGQDG